LLRGSFPKKWTWRHFFSLASARRGVIVAALLAGSQHVGLAARVESTGAKVQLSLLAEQNCLGCVRQFTAAAVFAPYPS